MTVNTVDLTEAIIFTVLRGVLLSIVPQGVEIVRGQINRVPTPAGPDYIVMTQTHREFIEVPTVDWDHSDVNPVTITMTSPVKETIQIDVHGPNGADTSWVIASMLRSFIGFDLFKVSSLLPPGAVIEPLYTEQPRQIPFVVDDQYQDRWIVETALQANINISITQDFANQLVAGIIPVHDY